MNRPPYKWIVGGLLAFAALLLASALIFSWLGDKEASHMLIERIPAWGSP